MPFQLNRESFINVFFAETCYNYFIAFLIITVIGHQTYDFGICN